jgi:hypothetical protein
MSFWRRPEPREDQQLVGITFVDLLFALVVGKVLDPLANYKAIPITGKLQLLVAGVLTITSWIGYHNSLSRPKYLIRFPNLPLVQFLIDIALVIVYWLTAVTAEGTVPGVSRPNSAVPEAGLIAVAFVLYFAWDSVALRMRRAPAYEKLERAGDVPARRAVTAFCMLVAGLTLLAALLIQEHWDPSLNDETAKTWIIIIDIWLIVLLAAYRFFKEWVSPAAQPPAEAELDVSRQLPAAPSAAGALPGSTDQAATTPPSKAPKTDAEATPSSEPPEATKSTESQTLPE